MLKLYSLVLTRPHLHLVTHFYSFVLKQLLLQTTPFCIKLCSAGCRILQISCTCRLCRHNAEQTPIQLWAWQDYDKRALLYWLRAPMALLFDFSLFRRKIKNCQSLSLWPHQNGLWGHCWNGFERKSIQISS